MPKVVIATKNKNKRKITDGDSVLIGIGKSSSVFVGFMLLSKITVWSADLKFVSALILIFSGDASPGLQP